MNIKLWALLRFVVPVLIGVFCIGILLVTESEMALVLLVVLGTVYQIIDRLLWKCPYCDGSIGKNRIKYCRCCGENVLD